jgi:hypothetical protein
MQKPLAVFAVSFLLSLGFASLSFASTLYLDTPFFALNSWLFGLVTLAVFFSVFYFLAYKYKIRALKSTVLALLLGYILGPAAFINLLAISSLPHPSLYGTYLLESLSVSSLGFFNFFLPSVIALLFVEVKQSRSANDQQQIQ